ncbi:MAG: murein L,D-transpeptidase catalytic domain-containing protein [Chitinophagaceae bacterium]
MKIVRLLLLSGIVIVAVAWFSASTPAEKKASTHVSRNEIRSSYSNKTMEKLEQKATVVKQFAEKKGFNETTCFLVDMSLPSGQSRFFIYDLKKDSIQATGPVAHGNCFEYWLEGRRYSNVVGSGCTSLGKYKVGNSYTGKWGYSYKLHGLDTTNSNAFERTVVLHSHSCVPEAETIDEICQSNGCPTVSPGMLLKLKAIINNSKKPLLLWIYD